MLETRAARAARPCIQRRRSLLVRRALLRIPEVDAILPHSLPRSLGKRLPPVNGGPTGARRWNQAGSTSGPPYRVAEVNCPRGRLITGRGHSQHCLLVQSITELSIVWGPNLEFGGGRAGEAQGTRHLTPAHARGGPGNGTSQRAGLGRVPSRSLHSPSGRVLVTFHRRTAPMPFAIMGTTGNYGRRPEAVCDACHNRITDAGTATYLYDSDERRDGATVALACTTECQNALVAEGARRGSTLKPGGGVQKFMLQVCINAGVISEQDARRLWPST